MIPFIDLQAQYQMLKARIDARIRAVLDHGQYIMGPEVAELEEKLADYVGVKHAVSCANGTDALQLALMTLGAQENDVIFCPSFTFFASAEAVSFIGATPVFVDVDERTFNISPLDLEQKIEAVIQEGKLNPRAIMAVDLFGLPADYPALELIAQKYGLQIIEDAAQGFGGRINERSVCSFGDIATTSFFPAKPLGCYGDGGAIFTDNDDHAEILRSLRVHGKGRDKYDNIRIGMNSRLDTLQAAILLEKLDVFAYELECREELASYYRDQLGDVVSAPYIPEGYSSAWAQYTLRLPDRDGVAARLKEKRIPSVVYYGKGMHEQTAYKRMTCYGSLEATEQLTKTVLSLPMHPYMSTQHRDEVSNALQSALA